MEHHLFGAGHHVAGRLQPGQPAGDDAPAAVGAADRAAVVVPHRGDLARRSVVGVKHVDVRLSGKIGMQRETQKAPVILIVYVCRQVGENCCGGVGDRVEDFDPAGLLRHEDPAVRREFDVHRLVEAGQDGLFAKARGQDGCHGGGRRGDHGHRNCDQECCGE
jgi:hypothetical protein